MTFETYAYRKRQQSRNGEPKIYTYDRAPQNMRYQIATAISEGIGGYADAALRSGLANANHIWEQIDRKCRKGLF
jgi:hypothetical protein